MEIFNKVTKICILHSFENPNKLEENSKETYLFMCCFQKREITKTCHIQRELCVTYNMGSGLGDWIYWHIIHTTQGYRQHSAIAYLHTLQFTVTHA
jgi:hypothetical protein